MLNQWKHSVLEHINELDMFSLLEDLCSRPLAIEPPLLDQDDAEDRLKRRWVYLLREKHSHPNLLDTRIQKILRKPPDDSHWREFQRIWLQIPNQLVLRHWQLVKRAAATYHRNQKIDNDHLFDDLISAAEEALFLAAKKYYFRPKGEFKNFAWGMLREKIRDEQNQHHPVPFSVRQKLKQLYDVREYLRIRGIAATFDELKQQLSMSDPQLRELLAVESLWGHGGDAEEDVDIAELEEAVDLSPSALSLLIQMEDRFRVEQALDKLSDRSRAVIEGLYFQERSIRELADDLQVTLNAFKKAHKQALQELREQLSV